MSPSLPSAVSAVLHAMSQSRPADVIEGVKNAVSAEMERLDPGLTIRQTRFFNHTYNPDLVVAWRENGKPCERRIFLRGSLGAALDGGDVVSLEDQGPMIIGLQQDKRRVQRRISKTFEHASPVLTTELRSVARVSRAVDVDAGAVRDPLGALVRGQLIRDGRGLLSEQDAARIDTVQSEDARTSLKAFSGTVNDLFTGATAERLTRTAQLVALFFTENPDMSSVENLREEPLSDAELAVVVPYVLSRSAEKIDPRMWDLLGAMFTLERIESLAQSLAGLDLTPMIAPQIGRLRAARTLLVRNPDELSDEDLRERPASWRIRSQKLSADAGVWALFFATDGRTLKGREGGGDARWSELSSAVDEFDLRSVALHGLSDRFDVAGEDPTRVKANVERLTETIRDDFHIPRMTVANPEDEQAPAIEVDFGQSTISVGKKASLQAILRLSTLLARRSPLSRDTLELLGLPDSEG